MKEWIRAEHLPLNSLFFSFVQAWERLFFPSMRISRNPVRRGKKA
jgi:hypothetical protein